jgi:metal-responsive CopG/Arc/MetJ family transcriptional regulator
MAKTAVLRARIDEQTVQEFDAIVEAGIGDRSDHLRAAVIEYIQRHRVTPQAEPPALEIDPIYWS